MENKICIDFNCDLGELTDGGLSDSKILPYVTSANIACGYHAGDQESMRRTVRMATEFGCNIGAHPGFPDKENFGRTEMNIPLDEIRRIVADQISTLSKICEEEGAVLTHVKPHGALYNMAARDIDIAMAVGEGIIASSSSGSVHDKSSIPFLIGLSGSKMKDAAHNLGLRFFSEVFSDRGYMPDGSLVPRSSEGALITDENEIVSRVIRMAVHNEVQSINGTIIRLDSDTLCLHGDGEHAINFSKRIRAALEDAGVTVSPLK